MKKNKITRGTLPPLFDRIVQEEDPTIVGKTLLDEKELEASIVHELSLILSTRCTVRKVIYEDHIDSIPFFGLPDFFGLGDFSYFNGSNSDDWPNAARLIESAIEAAEPRVYNVSVNIQQYNPVEQILDVEVYAKVKHSDTLKEIRFPLGIPHRSSSSQKTAA